MSRPTPHLAVAALLTVALAIGPLLIPSPARSQTQNPSDAGGTTGSSGSSTTSTAIDGTGTNTDPPRCNEQPPQPFLIRTNFIPIGRMTADERRQRRAGHERAIRYRTEQYGYFPGFGRPEWNPHPPRYYARMTRFMGLRVMLHEKIIPAIRCVEAEIQRTCAQHRYRPSHLAGIRFQNTYHTGEITNHAYGIAIDVDPSRNTCCGCVGAWRAHPLCGRRVSSVFERMAMPECWVQVFERFGFYWLGRDPMQDTMHFEFLGDPARITP